MSTGAKEQVRRMLALVPYLRGRGGVRLDDVSRDFGVTPGQIVKDLKVLWFCGLPGAMSGDLIEVDMDALEGDGTVHLDNADYLPRPLRLTVHEAMALIVALRTLRDVAGDDERAAVDRALAKLESAAGEPVSQAARVEVSIRRPDPAIATTVNQALRERRRLHLGYLVPARDETTERDVDPMRLVTAEGNAYLEAWCRRVEDVRLFRLDRVVSARLLDAPAEPPPRARPRDLSAGLFQPSPDDLLAVLDLEPGARWVADYYPTESAEELPDGRLRVRLRAGDPRWLRRLLLRLGSAASVVEPEWVAAEVREEAAAALEAYATG